MASGNVAQVPINIPTELCGITADVVGVGNPAAGNVCANESGGAPGTRSSALTSDEPGLLTGNVGQLPTDLPLELCGITAGVVTVGNTSAGNECGTGMTPVPVVQLPPPPAADCPPPPPPPPPPPNCPLPRPRTARRHRLRTARPLRPRPTARLRR
ncbi:chaplin [Catenulispora yoronensis]